MSTSSDPVVPDLDAQVEAALSEVMLPRRGDLLASTAVLGFLVEGEYELAESICKAHKEPARLALAIAILAAQGFATVEHGDDCNCPPEDDGPDV